MQTVQGKKVIKEEKKVEFKEQDFVEITKEFSWLKEERFTLISRRLLEEYGYLYEGGRIRLCELVNLLVQAREIVENLNKYLGGMDTHFLDLITTPDMKKRMILLVKEPEGKMSIRLPMER